MTLESAITFFIAIFIFGITPGPGIFAILARSMVHGARSCLWLSVGMVISDILYLLMACFGLAAIAANWETLFIVIRYVGAGYLIYLGWRMWRTTPSVLEESVTTPRIFGPLSSFTQGFLISASNPKVILFYIAFLPTFMDLTSLSSYDIVLAAMLTFVALLMGLMMVSMGAAQARWYLKSPKASQNLNRTAGSIMIGAGVFIGLRS